MIADRHTHLQTYAHHNTPLPIGGGVITHEYAYRAWQRERAPQARAESAEGSVCSAYEASAEPQTVCAEARRTDPRPDTDDALCDVIGCYGYDVNSAAAAAQGQTTRAGLAPESLVHLRLRLHQMN